MIVFIFVFFFQAEDGIRDHCVTGVQTCALPIFLSTNAYSKIQPTDVASGPNLGLTPLGRLSPAKFSASNTRERARSEERRVGKECRSRWARYH